MLTTCREVKEKEEKLCLVFLYLEKIYDRVPREVLKLALMRKKGPKNI
jgi:hypothetical protein